MDLSAAERILEVTPIVASVGGAIHGNTLLADLKYGDIPTRYRVDGIHEPQILSQARNVGIPAAS